MEHVEEAPLWREAEEGASSSSGGWGEDAARPAARPRRREGGWSDAAPASSAPARTWLTTRERREANPLAAPTLVSTLKGEALYGVAPVRAALLAKRRAGVHTLFVQSSMDLGKRKDAGAVGDVVARATALGASVRYVDKHELNLLTDDRPHQGVVLDCSPLGCEALRALAVWEQSAGTHPPVWVALDEVSDPQNLGAVLRSALFLGAQGVVVCERNSAPLSPVVSKASSGAMELLAVHATANMPQFLAACSVNGWAVLGADAGAGAEDVAGVGVHRPTVLVLGSEGKGLRTNVRRVCERLVCVPGGQSGEDDGGAGVDSLNVSVATGVLLHQLLANARAGMAARAGAAKSE